MEALIGLLVIALFLLPFAGFILSLVTRKRVGELSAEVEFLRRELNQLETLVRTLSKGASRAPAHEEERHPGSPIPAAPPVHMEASPFAPPVVPAEPEPFPAGPFEPIFPQEPVSQRERFAAGLPAEPPPPPPPPPVTARPPVTAPPPVVYPASPPPPPPPRPTQPAPPLFEKAEAPEPPPPKPAFDWEGLVGVKLFSWIAGIALVIGAVSFLRYSIQEGWLTPPFRLAIGLLTGVGLLVACEKKAARKYPVTANALDGAAIAILFSTFFAAHARWDLVPAGIAFGLMALTAAAGVLLAIRRDSVFIAVLGLVGGFSTPILLSTGEDRPIALFSYLALLNAGLAWVAHKKRWPLLSFATIVLTALYQWGWVARFLNEGKLPLALGIFLVFPALTFAALFFGEDEDTAREASFKSFVRAGRLATVVPLFFALFLAAVPAYGARYGWLFGFLALVAIGLAAVSIWLEEGLLHFGGAVSTLFVTGLWLFISYRSEAWPAVAFITLAFIFFFLAVPLIAEKLGRELTGAAVPAVIAAPLLFFTFPTLAIKESATASPWLLTGALLVAFSGVSLYAMRRREPALFHLAAAFGVTTGVVWCLKHLRAPNLEEGLFFLGVLSLALLLAASFSVRETAPAGGAALSREHRSFRFGLFFPLFSFLVLIPVVLGSRLTGSSIWPLVLVSLLVIAIGGVAIWLRAGGLWLATLLLAQLVLLFYSTSQQLARPEAGVAITLVGLLGAASVFIDRARNQDQSTRLFPSAALCGLMVGQLALGVVGGTDQHPPLAFVIVCQALLIAAVLVVATRTRAFLGVPLSVFPAYFAAAVFGTGPRAELWDDKLGFGLLIGLFYFAYPVILGKRLGKRLEPHLAAVIASGLLFALGRQCFIDGNLESIIAVLPVGEAAILAFLLWSLLKDEAPGERHQGRLALVAGAALAFITAAIPLQLEKEWITIGWALEAAALAWLYTRVTHKGLAATSLGLAIAVFVRLTFNPAVFEYHARTGTPVFNWYLYTYLVPALAFFVAAAFFRKTDDRLAEKLPRVSTFLPAFGTITLFYLVNIQIADYFSEGPALTFNFTRGASFAQDVAYTLAWAIFAIALLAAGVIFQNRPTRIASIGLLTVTILKAFLRDLPRLGGLYQVLSFVGLAISLALVAVAIQKFVLAKRTEGP